MPPEITLHQAPPVGISIVVVGNDALIEALPARPVQVALACRSVGFDLALPLSMGDELIADSVLRSLQNRPGEPAVMCACPVVRHRLLGLGQELEPLTVSTEPPPVAAARYVRDLYGSRVQFLAYVGRCPGARNSDYDATYTPPEFFRLLAESGNHPEKQAEFFDEVLPPDRRRFWSLPGGCPSPEALWHRCDERSLVELEGTDLAVNLAQYLLTRQSLLVDVASALGCACSGVTPATPGRSARIAVMSLEPPRSTSPVVEPMLLSSPLTGGRLADRTLHEGRERSEHRRESEEAHLPSALSGERRATPVLTSSVDAPGTRPPVAITPPTALGRSSRKPSNR
jgi:hypothetical protein